MLVDSKIYLNWETVKKEHYKAYTDNQNHVFEIKKNNECWDVYFDHGKVDSWNTLINAMMYCECFL